MSLDGIDPVLIAAGAARVMLWAAIAVIGFRQRRVLPLAFGVLAVCTSVVFSVTNAGGEVPRLVSDTATFVALPISGLILAHVMVSRPVLPAPRARRWHL